MSTESPKPAMTMAQKIRGALIFGVAGALLAGLYTFVVPAKWRAQVRLLVPLQESIQANPLPTLGLNQDQPTPLTMIAGLMKSEVFFRRLCKETGQPYKRMQNDLTVEPMTLDSQVVIKYPSYDRRLAIKVVTKALNAVTDINNSMGSEYSKEKAGTLAPALSGRQKDYDRIGKKLAQTLQNLKAPINLDDPGKVMALLDDLKSVEVDLATTRARKNEVVGQAKLSSTTGLEVPTQTGVSDETRKRIQAARVALKEVLITHGEEAPEVATAREELRVAEETGRKEASLRLQAINAGLDRTVADIEADRAALETKLAEVEKMWKGAPQAAVTFSTLKTEFDVLAGIVGDLRRKYESAQAEALTKQSTWVVLDEPFIENEPINKSYPKTCALGFLAFALIGFFGLPFMTPDRLPWLKRLQRSRQGNA